MSLRRRHRNWETEHEKICVSQIFSRYTYFFEGMSASDYSYLFDFCHKISIFC